MKSPHLVNTFGKSVCQPFMTLERGAARTVQTPIPGNRRANPYI